MPIKDTTVEGHSAAPARSQRAITPADADLDEVPRALEVLSIGGGASLVTIGVDDTVAVTRTVTAGQIINVSVRRVAAATTATVIGLYGG